ncbi:hypothetical protein NDN08_005090 [Rhodosorus marinus]|uniref:RING-type domain-containing protein n=1 Tax=Rhodosorus marinus TaxID=101924 RepID=A0AAV8V4W9_9RHOD|nr:hypothetical protein NDN08_005090 [Rhodosorus marinus]
MGIGMEGKAEEGGGPMKLAVEIFFFFQAGGYAVAVRLLSKALVGCTDENERLEVLLLRAACHFYLGNETACEGDALEAYQSEDACVKGFSAVLLFFVQWRCRKYSNALKTWSEADSQLLPGVVDHESFTEFCLFMRTGYLPGEGVDTLDNLVSKSVPESAKGFGKGFTPELARDDRVFCFPFTDPNGMLLYFEQYAPHKEMGPRQLSTALAKGGTQIHRTEPLPSEFQKRFNDYVQDYAQMMPYEVQAMALEVQEASAAVIREWDGQELWEEDIGVDYFRPWLFKDLEGLDVMQAWASDEAELEGMEVLFDGGCEFTIPKFYSKWQRHEAPHDPFMLEWVEMDYVFGEPEPGFRVKRSALLDTNFPFVSGGGAWARRPESASQLVTCTWGFWEGFFGQGFRTGSIDMTMFFGGHPHGEGQKSYRVAGQKGKGGREKHQSRQCLTCWAEEMWRKRARWNRGSSSTNFAFTESGSDGSFKILKRALGTLVFVLLLQLEAKASHHKVAKERDAQYLFVRWAFSQEDYQLVQLGRLVYAEAVDVIDGVDDRTSDTFLFLMDNLSTMPRLDTAEQESLGVVSGLLLYDEIACYKALTLQLAELLRMRGVNMDVERYAWKKEVDLSMAEDELLFWHAFKAKQPRSCRCCGDRAFVRRRMRKRAWYMGKLAIDCIRSEQMEEAETLVNGALVLRPEELSLVHLKAIILFALKKFVESGKILDDLLQKTGTSNLTDYRNEHWQLLAGTARDLFEQVDIFDAMNKRYHRSYETTDDILALAQDSTRMLKDQKERDRAKSEVLPKIEEGSCRGLMTTDAHIARERSPREVHTSEKELASAAALNKRDEPDPYSTTGEMKFRCAGRSCSSKFTAPRDDLVTRGLFMTREDKKRQRNKMFKIWREARETGGDEVKERSTGRDSYRGRENVSARPTAQRVAGHESGGTQSSATGQGQSSASASGSNSKKGLSSASALRKAPRSGQSKRCLVCMKRINSEPQYRQHIRGKVHCRLLVRLFFVGIMDQMIEENKRTLLVSELDRRNEDCRRHVIESFGSFEELQAKGGPDVFVITRSRLNEPRIGVSSAIWSKLDQVLEDERYSCNGSYPEFESTAQHNVSGSLQEARTITLVGLMDYEREFLGYPESESTEEYNEGLEEVDLRVDYDRAFPELGRGTSDTILRRIYQQKLVNEPDAEVADENDRCDICWGSVSGQRVAMVPCGHNNACISCVYNNFSRHPRADWRCHMCRAHVEDVYTEQEQRQKLKAIEKKMKRLKAAG